MEDKEKLHELLDSALADFVEASSSKVLDSSSKPTPDDLTKEFLMESIKTDDHKIVELLNGMQSSLGQLSVNFQQIFGDMRGSKPEDIWAKDTSKGFETAVKDFQEISKGLGALLVPDSDSTEEEAGLDDSMILPHMEKMLESLLCNDILTPSVNELLEKYPNYIEKNGDVLDPEEIRRYQKQLELFTTLSQHLKSEPSDKPEAKDLKFKDVLSTMQKLHECGKPPQGFIEQL